MRRCVLGSGLRYSHAAPQGHWLSWTPPFVEPKTPRDPQTRVAPRWTVSARGPVAWAVRVLGERGNALFWNNFRGTGKWQRQGRQFLSTPKRLPLALA